MLINKSFLVCNRFLFNKSTEAVIINLKIEIETVKEY